MRFSTTKSFFMAAGLLALGGAASACTFEAGVDVPGTGGSAPVSSTGTLTQRWSIGGQFNTRLCTTYGADRMQLVIRDQSSRLVARAFQPCEQMQMSVKLPEGSYYGDAWLIASDGTRVSTTLALEPFRILRGTETYIDTDFPLSSLLTAYGALEAVEALESSDGGATDDAEDADDAVDESSP
jgi:hypothetical protein